MTHTTVVDYLQQWSREEGDRVWLRDRKGDAFTEWTWRQAEEEINTMAAWLEDRYGSGNNFAILSRNRAHWILADMAITCSGNCSAPMFTTQKADVVRHLMDFTDVKALFLGESENWEQVRSVISDGVEIITFPDVEVEGAIRWNVPLEENRGRKSSYQCQRDDVFTLTFTSGTTGRPKGVMQTHDSLLYPLYRMTEISGLRKFPRLFSYLPMAHVGEREVVWIQSLLNCGEITFVEDMTTVLRDLVDVMPHQFFGAPRVWEKFSQVLLAQFGGQEGLDKALAEDQAATQAKAQAILGLQEAEFLVSASAPIPAALLHWYDKLGIFIIEGYGMSEANAILACKKSERRIGSIGKVPPGGVQLRLSDEGELLFKGPGITPGYYKMPEKTAETIVDGWLHTGDKMYVDEDGYYYITGRVKEYFKTIHGKYVAPIPIEAAFAENPLVQQQCLLGRGYSKTVLVCVLSPEIKAMTEEDIAASLKDTVTTLNKNVEKHERVGVIIAEREPWAIENGLLTVSMKMKRDEIEARFGEQAKGMARQAAERGEILVAFV